MVSRRVEAFSGFLNLYFVNIYNEREKEMGTWQSIFRKRLTCALALVFQFITFIVL